MYTVDCYRVLLMPTCDSVAKEQDRRGGSVFLVLYYTKVTDPQLEHIAENMSLLDLPRLDLPRSTTANI